MNKEWVIGSEGRNWKFKRLHNWFGSDSIYKDFGDTASLLKCQISLFIYALLNPLIPKIRNGISAMRFLIGGLNRNRLLQDIVVCLFIRYTYTIHESSILEHYEN